MTFLLRALAGASLGFALTLPAVGQPTPAQPVLKNPQVAIEYAPPRSPRYQPMAESMKRHRVLETLQEFLAPLRLPKPLTVRMAECGALEIAYNPGQPATICYEYLQEIENQAPGLSLVRVGPYVLTRDALVIGGLTSQVLNQVAYAVMDMLELPVWGRPEDAADYLAALVMLEFYPKGDVAWAAITGTAWLLAQRGFQGLGNFSDALRPLEAARFYNFACLAFGSPHSEVKDAEGNVVRRGFDFLVNYGDLSQARAARCLAEYRQMVRSFQKTIMPHVDLAKLKQVRDLDWSARLQIPRQPN